jgi:hypothetical protein
MKKICLLLSVFLTFQYALADDNVVENCEKKIKGLVTWQERISNVEAKLLVDGIKNPYVERLSVGLHLIEKCQEEFQNNPYTEPYDRLACSQINWSRPTGLIWFTLDYMNSYGDPHVEVSELVGLNQDCEIQYRRKTLMVEDSAD